MQRSKIEWLKQDNGKQGFTWNPVTGCDTISEGCRHCYARAMATRFNGGDFRVKIHPERLSEPFKVKEPSRIFVCSMGDIFHDDVLFDFIERVFETMRQCEHHTFFVLTKRIFRGKLFLDKNLRSDTFK